jgi:hypothetical protein
VSYECLINYQSPVKMRSIFTVAGLVELVEEMEEEVREHREP